MKHERTGRISIWRVQSDASPDYIQIKIEESGTDGNVYHAEMDCESFARALTGLSCVSCDVDVFENRGGQA